MIVLFNFQVGDIFNMRSQSEIQSKPKGLYSIDQILGTHKNNNTLGKNDFISFWFQS